LRQPSRTHTSYIVDKTDEGSMAAEKAIRSCSGILHKSVISEVNKQS
jgi:hypothetical protein